MIAKNYKEVIPPATKEAIDAWVEYARPPGGFVNAVLCNDFREAVGRADEHNILVLPEIACYLHYDVPSGCWGSPEKVQKWAESKRNDKEAENAWHGMTGE